MTNPAETLAREQLRQEVEAEVRQEINLEAAKAAWAEQSKQREAAARARVTLLLSATIFLLVLLPIGAGLGGLSIRVFRYAAGWGW